MLTSFDSHYIETVMEIMEAPGARNVRTKKIVRAIPGVTIQETGVPILTLRDINIKWFCAEAVWFFTGSKSPNFMRDLGFKAWNAFVEEGTLPTATGYRWRRHFGRDQLLGVINLLRHEPSSRHALMLSWDPSDDGLGRMGTKKKNVPCVFAYHFTIIDEELHLLVCQRSADMYYGLPHDISGAAIVQAIIAKHLDVFPGTLTHCISNAHVYADQEAMVNELIHRYESASKGTRPNFFVSFKRDPLQRAMDGDVSLVFDMVQQLEPSYGLLKHAPIKGPELTV